MKRKPPRFTLFSYKTHFRSVQRHHRFLRLASPRPSTLFVGSAVEALRVAAETCFPGIVAARSVVGPPLGDKGDRKSTRLNSSHSQDSYAVFCFKTKQTAPRQ